MIEIIQGWSHTGQQMFFGACLIAAFAAVCVVAINIRIVLRGYRPRLEAETIEAAKCEHHENLTGLCLKEGRNCQTKDECRQEIYTRE